MAKKPRKFSRKLNQPVKSQVISNKRAISQLKRGVEMHTHDYNNGVKTVTSATVAGTVTNLSLVAQGDGAGGREGLETSHKRIRLRYSIHGSSLEKVTRIVRIILFKAKFSNGALPTLGGLLESGDPDSFYRNQFKPKYQVLYDKRHVIGHRVVNLTSPATADASTGAPDMVLGTANAKVSGKMQYSNANATEADLLKGGIYMLIHSDVTTNPPQVSWCSRYEYLP